MADYTVLVILTTLIWIPDTGCGTPGVDLDTFLKNMDARVRPDVDGPPVRVKCNLYVVSFGSINMIDMDYTINIYLRQIWTDSRLQYNDTLHDRPLVLDANTMKLVWMPDLFFPNEKRASFHDMTVPNRMMRVFNNGTVVYSLRITMTIACSMSLYKFPMDDQKCFFKMESYSYHTDDLVLEWFGADPVEVDDEDLELPQFDLTSVKTSGCIKTYKTGKFPCLKATFHLHRQFGFYLLQTYIPTILIVILSWVSFWLHVEAVPARISLGVTTVLTMATQLSGSRDTAPKVSYPKALDVWLASCMLFVFSALLEYAFVNVFAREHHTQTASSTTSPTVPVIAEDVTMLHETGDEMLAASEEDSPEKSPRSPSSSGESEGRDQVCDNGGVRYAPMALLNRFHLRPLRSPGSSSDAPFEEPEHKQSRDRRHRSKAVLLDEASKYIFPGAFAVFNILYWTIYTCT